MGRVSHSVKIPVLASEAEALWYDLTRWPSIVDGFGHLDKRTGDWPHEGATLSWSSPPGGRGRVRERVVRYEPRAGQESLVEDERMQGRQRLTFEPAGVDDVRVTLELEYELKGDHAFEAIFDALFVRRPMRDSIARTLQRLRREAVTDRELAAGA
jgi:uncharacterized membrane protein